MKIRTTRGIDFYIGVPVCFMLSAFRRIAAMLPGWRKSLLPVRRILFIKLAEQGATVLASQAMKDAIGLVGQENVYFLAFQKNRAILDIMGLLPPDNILVVRDDSFLQFVGDMMRALLKIRARKIDTTVDMELFARISAIVAFLSGASRRVGLHRFANEGLYRGNLLTHRVQYNPHHHVAVHYDVLLAAAQRDPDEAPLAKYIPVAHEDRLSPFRPARADIVRLGAIMEEHGAPFQATRWVVFNPKFDDIMPIRRWPTACYLALGRRILATFPDVSIAISGIAEGASEAEALRQAIDPGRTFNFAGAFALRDLMVLLHEAEVLVTSDSGPAHFASLTDVDIVVMFGPEIPALYAPLGPRVHAIHIGLACSPCLSAANQRLSFCQDNKCMQFISVEQVYEITAACLNARAAVPHDGYTALKPASGTPGMPSA
ncbi:MAG: glycosyltransferase family 9 protein [Candidatus Hydrogenedentes bacterium]|nr:glycosyltransferase family 9 protein [Candidatus Hydrogenedentota bacterium]